MHFLSSFKWRLHFSLCGATSPVYFLFSPLRPVTDAVDVAKSEMHTDPKQLRKLRQQQLQQKFRKEMEAKRLQQNQDQAKSEQTEVAIGRGSSGGNDFICCITQIDFILFRAVLSNSKNYMLMQPFKLGKDKTYTIK